MMCVCVISAPQILSAGVLTARRQGHSVADKGMPGEEQTVLSGATAIEPAVPPYSQHINPSL